MGSHRCQQNKITMCWLLVEEKGGKIYTPPSQRYVWACLNTSAESADTRARRHLALKTHPFPGACLACFHESPSNLLRTVVALVKTFLQQQRQHICIFENEVITSTAENGLPSSGYCTHLSSYNYRELGFCGINSVHKAIHRVAD